MKTRLLLSAIVTTATVFGASSAAHTETLDVQAQASALLRGSHVSGSLKAVEVPYTRSLSALDAHASAAAVLSGRSPARQPSGADRVAVSDLPSSSLDAHAHAASLLRGAPITIDEDSRSTQVNEALGAHPAVLVAQAWATRGIDPTTFIVAHPARLLLLAASPTESRTQSEESVAALTN